MQVVRLFGEVLGKREREGTNIITIWYNAAVSDHMKHIIIMIVNAEIDTRTALFNSSLSFSSSDKA